MNATYRAWQAGFVRRWHTNFDLCDTVDSDAGHQGRVGVLTLKLFPNASRALIIAAITHDQGEVGPGDVSYDAKKASPAFCAMSRELEAAELKRQGLTLPDLTLDEVHALKLCDWLDAWLWMMREKPHLALRKDWAGQLAVTVDLAERLGVADEVIALADAAREVWA